MPVTSTSALDYLDQIAVVAGGLFAGTALCISAVEVPAFQELGSDEHWRFFPHMYKKAAVTQSLFAGLAGAAGIAHGTRIVGSSADRNLWLVAGTAFFGMLPYTVLCLGPTNQRIINDSKLIQSGGQGLIDTATQKELLDKWAVLHLGRTVGSVVAFGAMAYGLSRHNSLLFGW